MAALGAFSVGGLIVDDRTLLGAPVWLKPLKFSLSFVLYGLAWAWLISLVKPSRTLKAASAVILTTSAIEMVVLFTQSFRGRESHFNTTTAFDAVLFGLMGTTILVFWIATLIASVVIGARRVAPRPENLAIRLGLGISLVGMALGALMTNVMQSSREGFSGTHSVGVVEGGPGMPLTGWSTTGGDLRIAHFVGLHALQVLPLLALALTMLAARHAALRSEEVRTRMVWTAGLVYAGLIALVTWQALRGQPLLAPDWQTLTALAALLGAGAAGMSWALAAESAEHELVAA
ncbi:hypothetical protein ACTG9Q_21570 [Actinokineospora sp. 24-640]